jgi:peptidoglycan/LPS O-acetylase OafA/YrhL
LKDSDLIRACLCGVLAALVMSYVNRVTAPVFGHVLLALVGLCATMAAFLSIARSQAEPEVKVLTVIGGGAISIFCLALLS